ncbi:sulfotransferase [Tropicimonas marinistellae]|uniref:sulfotransferase n=1 Tax=Tropicimonas marinistellae TaxID=1739787 RepID=UPI0008330593|nr:sulfotransferase [Tropicimonas marinistellae]
MTANPDFDPRFRQPRRIVFGIGAAKSGTSWLNALLRAHPEVHVAHQRELHYWDVVRPPFNQKPKDHARTTLDALERQALWSRLTRAPALRYYRAAARMREAPDPRHSAYADVFFEGYRGAPVAGEVTPAYALLDASTYAEMAALNDDCRFVFLMRDPISRLHAGIRHKLRKSGEHTELTEAQVLAELKHRLAPQSEADMRRAYYLTTIGNLEQAVPRERVHYEFFENLFRPESVARLFAFLGLKTLEVDPTQKRNAGWSTGAPMSEEFRALAGNQLGGVYRAIRDRFGTQVPESWLDPTERN